MGKPQDLPLCSLKRQTFGYRENQSGAELVGCIVVMNQFADVVQQAGNKKLFRMFFTDPQGELPCGCRRAKAMFPECRERQGPRAFLLEHIDDTCRENQLFESVVPNSSNCVRDSGYWSTESI
jgi:hypothetical protein